MQLATSVKRVKHICQSLILNLIIPVSLICSEMKPSASFTSVALLAPLGLSEQIFPLAHNVYFTICSAVHWYSSVVERSCLYQRGA